MNSNKRPLQLSVHADADDVKRTDSDEARASLSRSFPSGRRRSPHFYGACSGGVSFRAPAEAEAKVPAYNCSDRTAMGDHFE